MALYVSDLLTATAAPVNAVPTATRTWQWLRGSTAISGATSSTYTAVTADIGATIAASQIETNVAGTATATSAPTEVIQAFDPIRLFSASEPGVWYDPNDITTLFKGPTVQAPVTTPGDSVWLMLDKSRGAALGPELVTNGDFNDPTTTGWTAYLGASLSVDGARLKITSAGGSSYALYAITTVVGKWYKFIVGYDGTAFGGGMYIYPASTTGGAPLVASTPLITGAGTTTLYFAATGTTSYILVQGVSMSAGQSIFADNISVREVPGNHATQSITASQPIYGIVPAGGRRNILTFSEQFDNAIWGKSQATVPPTQYLAPNGTITADKLVESTSTSPHYLVNPFVLNGVYTLSVFAKAGERSALNIWSDNDLFGIAYFNLSDGTRTFTTGSQLASASIEPVGTDGWYRCSITTPNLNKTAYFVIGIGNPFSYTGDDTSGVYLWGAQLEQSATATPYQRVTTQYDVTEAGVASLGYLFFDGSGDFMSTGTITPGTDKAQVFTGVRRFADSLDVIAEFSGNWNALDGSFLFWGGTSMATGTGPGFNSGARGNAAASASQAGISPTTFTPPVTAVLTVTHDISGDLSSVRGNGVAGVNGTADKGTGNFLAYPLYIGRRSNGDFPLEGQLFPLIVRFGPNLTTARIAATESWVASKTAGVTL